MDNKTIIVLGGGIGGIVTATQLRKKLSKEHRVILIERESEYVFSPSLPWLMAGLRQAKNISRPRTKLVKLGVEIIQGNIEKIDPQKRCINVNGQQFTCDYMVIALGAEMAAETIPGLAETGFTFYTLAGA